MTHDSKKQEDQITLDACAQEIVALARGGHRHLDMIVLTRGIVDAHLGYLADRVELHSGGAWTIRRASAAVLQNCLGPHLVLCPRSTPSGEVAELRDDMILVCTGRK